MPCGGVKHKRPWLGKSAPLKGSRGAGEVVLRACLNPASCARGEPAREILYPSFRARVGCFGSTAATKCVSTPATMAPSQGFEIFWGYK